MIRIEALPRWQWGMLGAIALGCLLSGSGALYPQNTWLQVGPVLVGLPLAAWALARRPISNGGAACLTAFLLLHLFAAHWTYSFVPYPRWADEWLGLDTSALFETDRNMFDRLVHFAFGLLMVPPVSELARRHAGMARSLALVFAVLFVGAVSAVYEIAEWLLTMSLSPADAGAYNGEQGDRFDAQKDMACAVMGALCGLPLAFRARRSR